MDDGLPELTGISSPTEQDSIAEAARLIEQAGANMREGRLELLGAANGLNESDAFRVPQYVALYHPAKPMQIVGSDFSDVLAIQGTLVTARVQHFEQAHNEAPHEPVESIEVGVNNDRKLLIADGHHRFNQCLIVGKSVPMSIWLQIDDEEAVSWKNVIISEGSGRSDNMSE